MVLRGLWRPMLAVALTLHVLVLLAPLGAQKKAPPKEDKQPVKITRLSTRKKLPQASRVAKVRPNVQRRTTPKPPPAIVTKATPTPSPVVAPTNTKAAGDSKSEGDTTKLDPITERFTESFGGFAAMRTQVDGSEQAVPLRAPGDAPITADLFPDPNAFFSDITKLTKRAGLVTFDWFSPIKPDSLFTEYIEPTYTGNGFTITLKGEYGGGEVYELKNGNDVRYFNVVPTGDRTGTLIMVWKNSPI